MDRQLVDITDIRVRGELGDRIEQAFRNVVGFRTREMYAKPTGEYEWSADFVGRWLEMIAAWLPYFRGEPVAVADAAARLIAGLRPNGSFHAKNKDFRVRAGNYRGILGLVYAYRLAGNEAYLDAARKAGLWYYNQFMDRSRYPRRPLFSTQPASVISSLVKLHALTGDRRFLDVSERLADFTIEFSQRVFNGYSVHSHTWLMCARGLVDLVRVTREERFLRAAKEIRDYVRNKKVWLSGGISEIMNNAEDQVDEACSTSDWLRLNLALWQVTGDATCLEDAENAVFNHLTFNQIPNGGMSAACNISQGLRCAEGWYCCSMQVPMALRRFARTIYALGRDTIFVNFFVPSRAQLHLNARQEVMIEQTGAYPENSKVALVIKPAAQSTFNVALRIPSWVSRQQMSLRLNGKTVEKPRVSGGYLTLRRAWKNDKITLEFPMPLRVATSVAGLHKPLGRVRVNERPPVPAKLIGVFRGPLLLAVFRTDHNLDVTWANRNGFNEVLDSGGYYGKWGGSMCDIARQGDNTIGTDAPVKLTEVSVSSSLARLCWASRLGEIAAIQNEITVPNRLPVTITHAQCVRLRPGKAPEALLLCGTRIAKKKEQWHDKYRDLFTYEYDAPVLASDRGKVRQIQRLSKQGEHHYSLKNSVFEVNCSCKGDVEALVPVEDEKWLGAYLAPARRKTSAAHDSELHVVKTMVFPRPRYRAAAWSDRDKSSEITQYFGTKKRKS